MKNFLSICLLTVLGLISGVISGYATTSNFFDGDIIFLGPGVIYAVFLLLYFLINHEKLSYKVLAIIGVSTIAYYCAVYVTIRSFAGNFDTSFEGLGWASFIIGGGVGALILTAGLKYFYGYFSYIELLFLTVIGAVLGMISPMVDHSVIENPFFLFVIWQTGMSIAFGVTLMINKRLSFQRPPDYNPILKKIVALLVVSFALFLFFGPFFKA